MSLCNRLQLQAKQPSLRLAMALLCGGVAVTGCLLPQDDLVIPDLPPKRNSPLQIVSYFPGGQKETTALVGVPTTTCKPTEAFRVVVREPDVGDQTRSQWYIDRTDGTPAVGGGTFDAENQALERTITAPNALANQLSTLIDGKRHVVEVFVTDGDFVQDKVGEATRAPIRQTDGGVLIDPAFVATNWWLVQVERCQ